MNSLDISIFFSDKIFLSIDKLCEINNFKNYAFQIILIIKRLLCNLSFINWNFYLEKIFIYFYPIISNSSTSRFFFISYKYQGLKIYDYRCNPNGYRYTHKYIKNIFLIFKEMFETFSLEWFFQHNFFEVFNLKYFSKSELSKFNKKINRMNNLEKELKILNN